MYDDLFSAKHFWYMTVILHCDNDNLYWSTLGSYYMYILLFREKSWEGIINRKPTKSEYTSALQNKDLFL